MIHQEQSLKPRASRWPWVFAFLIAVSGTSISFLLWRARMVMERNTVRDEFQFEAKNLQGMVAQEIQLFTDVLDSIRQLHGISDQITSKDFEEFVGKGMTFQKNVLQGFGFVQRIDQDTRNLMQQLGPNGLQPSLMIQESAGRNGFKPARDRPEYFALTYQTPADVLHVPVGFDFESVEPYQQAINRMRESGAMSLAGKIPGSLSEYYVFAPILYSEFQGSIIAPPGFLVGFAAAIFRPDRVINHVTEAPVARGLHISLTEKFSALDGRGYNYQGPIAVADQTWILNCTASPDYLLAHRTQRPEWILLIGLTITLLVTFELVLMARRGRRIEQVVRTRTADLLAAKAMLEREMAERMRLESEILEIGSREKMRVGQDLHDSLGQKLTGAVFLSRTLATKLADAGGEERDSAEHINELLKDALSQVRRLARGLAPVELGDEGLANALQRLATDTREACKIDCTFHPEDDGRVRDNKVAVHLYHVAQEAVSNAVRHGKPSRILITLAAGADGGGRLTIENDGAGIPVEAERGQGMGLRIMHYRAAMIGGSLDVQRSKEGGTIVICRFSVSPKSKVQGPK